MKGAFKLTDKLHKWLELKNWTQRELAQTLECDESLVSQVLNGSKHPSWQLLNKLCWLTGLDVGDILFFDRDAEQEDNQ